MAYIFLILVMIVAEILTWVMVGRWLGSGWYVFFWFIAAFMIGLTLLKSCKAQLSTLQMNLMTGIAPDGSIIGRALAGVLLMIPGLLTDLLALLVLLPPVQRKMQTVAMGALQKRQGAMLSKMMGGNAAGANPLGAMGTGQGNPFADLMRQMDMMRGGSNVIEGEAHEVQAEQKRIDAPRSHKTNKR